MNYFFVLLLLFPLAALAKGRGREQNVQQPQTATQEIDKSDDHNFLPLGTLTREQILGGLKLYNWRYVEYVPKSDPVQAIHNYGSPLEIKVFLGDWCKDSKKHIPGFIKSMEFADNKNIQITYINLDPQKKEPADLLAGWNIQSIPTFIILLNGKELGRIVETPKSSVEQDIADILASAPPAE